jgi:hypothetical protein
MSAIRLFHIVLRPVTLNGSIIAIRGASTKRMQIAEGNKRNGRPTSGGSVR